ncbi:MAG: hypothetical protein AAF624_10210 [Bacteroidota bacterium]
MESALVPLAAGAVALLLIVSGIVLWISRSRAAKPTRTALQRPQDDLRSLGIVDIRPMEKSVSDEAAVVEGAPEEIAAETEAQPHDVGPHDVGPHDRPAQELERLPADDGLPADAGPRPDGDVRVADLPSAAANVDAEVSDEDEAADEHEVGGPVADVRDAAAPLEDEHDEGKHDEAYPEDVAVPEDEAGAHEDEVVLLDDGSALRDGGAVVLDDDARSALEEAVSEELGAAIAEVEGASETTPLRPAHAVAFGEADLLDDYDELVSFRFPDPREFDDELDLPLPLPGDDLDLVRRPASHALAHLVESIWSGLRAQTVALLRHDAATLHYKVEALKSEHPAVVGVDEFASAGSALRGIRGETDDLLPMLLKGASLDALGYYSDLSAVGRAYVQPLTAAEAPSLLLVVDTAPEARAYSPVEKGLLRQFASVLAHLAAQEMPAWFVTAPPTEALTDLPTEAPALVETATPAAPSLQEAPAPEVEAREAATPSPEGEADEDTTPMDAPSDAALSADSTLEAASEEAATSSPERERVEEGEQAEPGTPVARRVIVAEEMERARARQYPLALALVHRTDAEAVADGGPAAVEQAEATLRQHLDHTLALADGRVEPFGELLYGVFYYGRAADVEAWVELVRTTPASGGETLPLTIGVALYGDRHQTSEQLRGDAVQALADAYDAQVGCVILE